MKITVLGCSNTWTPRFTSCYLVNDDILLDCGQDAYKKYLQVGKDIMDIKLFVLTHFHADHIFGMNMFLTAYQRKKSNLSKPMIVGGEGVQEAMERVFENCNLFHVDLSDFFEFKTVGEGDTFSYGNITFEAHLLNHGDVTDVGYILTDDNGVRFGYAGDAVYEMQMEKFVQKCDICFLSVSRRVSSPKHLGMNDFFKMQQMFPTKMLYAVHCDEDVYTDPQLAPFTVHEDDVFDF